MSKGERSLERDKQVFVNLVVVVYTGIYSPVTHLSEISLNCNITKSHECRNCSTIHKDFLSHFFENVGRETESFQYSHINTGIPFLTNLPCQVRIGISFPYRTGVGVCLVTGPGCESGSGVSKVLKERKTSGSCLVITDKPPRCSYFKLRDDVSERFPEFLFRQIVSDCY